MTLSSIAADLGLLPCLPAGGPGLGQLALIKRERSASEHFLNSLCAAACPDGAVASRGRLCMRTWNQFILFYFIEIIFLAIAVAFATGEFISTFRSAYFWIIPAIFNSLGLLIAAVVYELKLRPKEKKTKIYTIGYLIGFLALIGLFVVGWFSKPAQERNPSNKTKNHYAMKYFVNDDEEYIRVAFDKLESKFKNPEDFKLNAFIVHKQDTTIDGVSDTVYNIFFTYFLQRDTTGKYFSKISVLRSVPTLQIYNQETKANGEYIKLKLDQDEMQRNVMQSLKESLQQKRGSAK